MNNPFQPRAPRFDAQAIHHTIQQALACAGLDTAAGPMLDVTEIIRNALASGGLAAPAAAGSPASTASVVDVVARVIEPGETRGQPSQGRPAPAEGDARGSFDWCTFSNHAGKRSYKLYVPAALPDAPPPLVVMLHGCTQSADDFAAGTQMNRLADQHGFLVVYPEQPAQANASKCWNWFRPQDQRRDAGEPSIIAGVAREVAQRHGADPHRIFVAGLSAGAAMALVMGETYPELFAGVGAHSGLPYGSAHDIPSAMAAMKGGRSGLEAQPGAAAAPRRKGVQAVPLIVFHGDRDHTVRHSNAAQITERAAHAYQTQTGEATLLSQTQASGAAGGRRFSRTVHADAAGQPLIECWTVHGAGHAWSGGDSSGSYTDRQGPDASAEMVRFFLALPRAGCA